MMSQKRQNLRQVSLADAAPPSGRRACPRCNSSVFRVTRRLQDFLMSLFVPVCRYRCISMGCSWEGNLREKREYLPGHVHIDSAQTFIKARPPKTS